MLTFVELSAVECSVSPSLPVFRQRDDEYDEIAYFTVR